MDKHSYFPPLTIIISVAVAGLSAILFACIVLLVVGLLIFKRRKTKHIETISERNYLSDEMMKSLQGGPVYEELNLNNTTGSESLAKTVQNTMYEKFFLDNERNTYQLSMDMESQSKTVHNALYEESCLENK